MQPSEPARALLDALSGPNRVIADAYPERPSRRQPVHTFYLGAQAFRGDTLPRLADAAQRSLSLYGPDPLSLARGVGFLSEKDLEGLHTEALLTRFTRDPDALREASPAGWLACAVHARVHEKLLREPVEDLRIDFEDGFGVRSDEEEDAAVDHAAEATARALAAAQLPPFFGLRIKTLSERSKARAARTLERFVAELLCRTDGVLPGGFVVTLPKVTCAAQVDTLARLLSLLETRHGLAEGALKLELMIEVPQSLMGLDGRSPLPGFLQASRGRCVGAHFGTYDFTASCDLTAAQQTMDHPICDVAKSHMRLAYAGTGLFLSDGASHVLPIEPHPEATTAAQCDENRAAVHRAWRVSHGHIVHSLRGGYYQGWDTHPAQLPARYATCFAFFLAGFSVAAARLRAFLERSSEATRVSAVFDDVATGQALLGHVLRAYHCGAVGEDALVRTGLSRDELELGSFARILQARAASGAAP